MKDVEEKRELARQALGEGGVLKGDEVSTVSDQLPGYCPPYLLIFFRVCKKHHIMRLIFSISVQALCEQAS